METPSLQSTEVPPTNKTNGTTTKALPVSTLPFISAATATSKAPTPVPRLPTYDSTKNSVAYKNGKDLLADGNFDAALAKLRNALAATLSFESLPANLSNRDLHESLGPLYYLYGSTLLYKIDDDVDDEKSEQQPNGDVQIAWENLENARVILDRMCTTLDRLFKGSSSSSTDQYRDDLSDVHLRLGDLQRGSFEYEKALDEYSAALKLRLKVYGTYRRSVADCHYMLGITHLSLAQSLQSEEIDQSSGVVFHNHRQREKYYRRAILQFRACGYALGGCIGKLSGVDLGDLVKMPPSVYDWEDEDEEDTLTPSLNNLEKIRDAVTSLVQVDDKDAIAVMDMKELLNETTEMLKDLDDRELSELDEDELEEQLAAEMALKAAAEDDDDDDEVENTLLASDALPVGVGSEPNKKMKIVEPVVSEATESSTEPAPNKDNGDKTTVEPSGKQNYVEFRSIAPQSGPQPPFNRSILVVPEHRRQTGTMCKKASLCEQCVIQ